MKNTLISSPLAAELDLTRPCVTRAAEAPIIDVPGERAALKLPASKTAGRVTALSLEVAVNSGPPSHMHTECDEIFLIQSGAFEYFVNGQRFEARAGDVVYGARNEAHRFRGLDSGERNEFNILIAPGGFEHFFSKWATLLQKGAPDPVEAVQLCSEHDIMAFPSDAEAPVVSQPQSKLVPAGQMPLRVLGDNVTVLLGASDTEGRYSLVRVEGPRDSGPPLHIHENEDELFLIEAGTFEFTLGEETVLAHAGDVVWGPRGFAHTFRVATESARMAVFMTPGGFDQFFVQCALTELAGNATHENILALGEQFGLSFVPPSR